MNRGTGFKSTNREKPRTSMAEIEILGRSDCAVYTRQQCAASELYKTEAFTGTLCYAEGRNGEGF